MKSKKSQEELNEQNELERKLKNIEYEKKVYGDQMKGHIKTQKNMIEQLVMENEKLKEEVSAQVNQMSKNRSNQASQQKLNVAEEIKQIKLKIEEEKTFQQDMDDNIKTLQQEIIEQKRKQKGVNGTQERHSQIAKQIKILENRLDKANQKFNEAIAHNKELRETIDSLRRERVIFDNIYRKLEKELHNKRKDMANIIEIANSAYEERDRAQEKLAMLLQQADREKTDYEKELSQVSNLIEKDRQMKDLMRLKETEKSELERMTLNKSEGGTIDDKLSRTNFKKSGMWSSQKEKAQSAVCQEKAESYMEAFAKIEAATGIHDIDQLVKNFIQAEEKNFTLFKFVNELSNEIENLEVQIAEMQEEIDRQRGSGSSTDNQRKKLLKELEEKLSKTEMKAEQLGLEYGQAQTKVNSIKASIENIFNVVQCDAQAHRELLGTQGVTESNMMTYMGIIEQRINEILQVYQYIQQHKQYDNFEQEALNLGLGPSVSAIHGPMRIEPPSFGEDLSDDNKSEEGSEKPMGIEEFKQKVENSRKEDNSKKKFKSYGKK